MVTLALALVTFSDKSKDVFYEFYFAVFSLLLFKRKGKKEKKQTNKQQNKTESEPLPTFCEMCTTQSCVQFHHIQEWDT